MIYSSLHLVVERMEELMEGTSLEESGWFQGEIFQITCSVSWYGQFWSTTNFWGSWKRAVQTKYLKIISVRSTYHHHHHHHHHLPLLSIITIIWSVFTFHLLAN